MTNEMKTSDDKIKLGTEGLEPVADEELARDGDQVMAEDARVDNKKNNIAGVFAEDELDITRQRAKSPRVTIDLDGVLNEDSKTTGDIATGQPTDSLDGSDLAENVRATPAARRVAREMRIDIQKISGSGPRGRIEVDDVAKLQKRPSVSQITKRIEPTIIKETMRKKEPVVVGTNLESIQGNPQNLSVFSENLEEIPFERFTRDDEGLRKRLKEMNRRIEKVPNPELDFVPFVDASHRQLKSKNTQKVAKISELDFVPFVDEQVKPIRAETIVKPTPMHSIREDGVNASGNGRDAKRSAKKTTNDSHWENNEKKLKDAKAIEKKALENVRNQSRAGKPAVEQKTGARAKPIEEPIVVAAKNVEEEVAELEDDALKDILGQESMVSTIAGHIHIETELTQEEDDRFVSEATLAELRESENRGDDNETLSVEKETPDLEADASEARESLPGLSTETEIEEKPFDGTRKTDVKGVDLSAKTEGEEKPSDGTQVTDAETVDLNEKAGDGTEPSDGTRVVDKEAMNLYAETESEKKIAGPSPMADVEVVGLHAETAVGEEHADGLRIADDEAADIPAKAEGEEETPDDTQVMDVEAIDHPARAADEKETADVSHIADKDAIDLHAETENEKQIVDVYHVADVEVADFSEKTDVEGETMGDTQVVDIETIDVTAEGKKETSDDSLIANEEVSDVHVEEEEADDELIGVSQVAASIGMEESGETKRDVADALKKMIRYRSKIEQHAPTVTLTVEIDMTEVKNMRKKIARKIEEQARYRCAYTDFLLMATARALVKHPCINARVEGDEVTTNPYVNIGLTVESDLGCIVPVILNVQGMNFVEIVKSRGDLLRTVKNKSLNLNYLEGSTFTIANLGMYGVREFTSAIHQTNSAILSVGEVVPKICVYRGEPAVRSMMKVTLNLDYRAGDGNAGAKFLKDIRMDMENPSTLLF